MKRILVVGDYPTREEVRKHAPFTSPEAQILRRMLQPVLKGHKVTYTNVMPQTPLRNHMNFYLYPNNDTKTRQPTRGIYPKPDLAIARERIRSHVLNNNYDLIIPVGDYALWALIDDEELFPPRNIKGFKVPPAVRRWCGSQMYCFEHTPMMPLIDQYMFASYTVDQFRVRSDINKRIPLALDNNWGPADSTILIRPNLQHATGYLNKLLKEAESGQRPIAVDIETRAQQIVCLGIADSSTSAICIPFTEGVENYWAYEEELIVLNLLRKVFSHPNILIAGQNFQFDIQYIIFYFQVRPYVTYDTMLMQHLILPGTELGLDVLSAYYCAHHRYWKDDGKYATKGTSEEDLWTYNGMDCIKTFEIMEVLIQAIDYYGLTEQWTETHEQLDEILTATLRGCAIDLDMKAQVSEELHELIQVYADKLEDLLPRSIYARQKGKAAWYASPQQVATVFGDVFNLKPFFNRKTRSYTTDDSAMEYYKQSEPIMIPFCETLQAYRKLSKYTTFTDMKLDHDNRMRSEFIPAAETFRWRSGTNVFNTGGNLQNLPEKDKGHVDFDFELPNIRKQYVPDPGHTIYDIDLAGADAQVVAWEANEPTMKAAFRAGEKIHVVNARDCFDECQDMTNEEIKNSKYYDWTKRAVHATNYVGGAPAVAIAIGWPIPLVEKFQARYFAKRPNIKDWHNRTDEYLQGIRCWNCNSYCDPGHSCSKCGAELGMTVKTQFGYRRRYIEATPDNLLKDAVAWVPQATVAIVTRKAILIGRHQFPWIQFLLQVHDSLIFQVPTEREAEVDAYIQACNDIVIPYDEPLRIPWGVKKSRVSWGDCA